MSGKQKHSSLNLSKKINSIDKLSKNIEGYILEIRNKNLINQFNKLQSNWEKSKLQLEKYMYTPDSSNYSKTLNYFKSEFKTILQKISLEIIESILRRKLKLIDYNRYL